MSAEEFVHAGCRNGDVYDVVLAFRVVYLFEQKSLPELYRKMSLEFLHNNGLVVDVWPNRADHPEYYLKIVENLAPKRHFPTTGEIVNDFAKAQMPLIRQYEFLSSCDFSNPDLNLVKWASVSVGHEVSMDEFDAAVRRVWPNGKSDKVFWVILIFQQLV
jgi:hypothetical protein